jgi:hypothetical protein
VSVTDRHRYKSKSHVWKYLLSSYSNKLFFRSSKYFVCEIMYKNNGNTVDYIRVEFSPPILFFFLHFTKSTRIVLLENAVLISWRALFFPPFPNRLRGRSPNEKGSRSGRCGVENISYPCQESSPGHSTRSTSLYLLH